MCNYHQCTCTCICTYTVHVYTHQNVHVHGNILKTSKTKQGNNAAPEVAHFLFFEKIYVSCP